MNNNNNIDSDIPKLADINKKSTKNISLSTQGSPECYSHGSSNHTTHNTEGHHQHHHHHHTHEVPIDSGNNLSKTDIENGGTLKVLSNTSVDAGTTMKSPVQIAIPSNVLRHFKNQNKDISTLSLSSIPNEKNYEFNARINAEDGDSEVSIARFSWEGVTTDDDMNDDELLLQDDDTIQEKEQFKTQPQPILSSLSRSEDRPGYPNGLKLSPSSYVVSDTERSNKNTSTRINSGLGKKNKIVQQKLVYSDNEASIPPLSESITKDKTRNILLDRKHPSSPLSYTSTRKQASLPLTTDLRNSNKKYSTVDLESKPISPLDYKKERILPSTNVANIDIPTKNHHHHHHHHHHQLVTTDNEIRKTSSSLNFSGNDINKNVSISSTKCNEITKNLLLLKTSESKKPPLLSRELHERKKSPSPQLSGKPPISTSTSPVTKSLSTFLGNPATLSNNSNNPSTTSFTTILPNSNVPNNAKSPTNTSSINTSNSKMNSSSNSRKEVKEIILLKTETFLVYNTGKHLHNYNRIPIISENSFDMKPSKILKPSFYKALIEEKKLDKAYSILDYKHSSHPDSTMVTTNDCYKKCKVNKLKEEELYLSSSSNSTDDSNEKLIPKVVNKNSIIGPDEFRLINRISNRIYNILEDEKENIPQPKSSTGTFSHIYGKPIAVIGEGSYGVLKLCSRPATEKDDYGSYSRTYNDGKNVYFAIKEFARPKLYSSKKFSTKITSEFIIGHSLNEFSQRSKKTSFYPNIFNLLVTDKTFIEVMEFCAAGDLFTLMNNKLKNNKVFHPLEADCIFKQILYAIKYMHDHCVAHCDIKPENILLHKDGLVKVCDFGVSQVFQTGWEKNPHYQKGARGSEPYVAPEEFIKDHKYDPKLSDCWSCGIIYCNLLMIDEPLWKVAIASKDPIFKDYCHQIVHTKKFQLIETKFKHINAEHNENQKQTIYGILRWEPEKRLTVTQVLETHWMRHTICCVDYLHRREHTNH
ncbi:hypothetical protein TBLA_0C05800 [Henningerozyma blattae CBS 6284]|uniref:non-specific serine/threonine protein kinase n=1 Tax=Henningerozyma blattae (strain ATCC 34711 / CBS 6284 / DSM 70876 / NBRC 10599 / NRRL Y-10934 / UCD 77-7) TaxID=1071380 RepID=I2H1X6_HENB6|nr:hypothetical protein TBLA_0C05800 [Tetrapisispora blattae CBS 6284]CCH60378.1 hypothetical protein TBLA_0C05800 [Tetrapisispora blattae CBS 6284]